MVARDVHDEQRGEEKGRKGKGREGGWQEGKGTRGWMPLELLTWYLPTLEMDDDDDDAVGQRGNSRGNFFALICTQNSCY